uniref:calcium-binding protein n=1 Tax=uncultured Rhizobium sp. TaxID=155567 RepID=UPI0026268353|nr:hypothetical protein [uncultured Rhizobium sp.]
MHIQKDDLTVTWTLDEAGGAYILTASATIENEDDPAVYVQADNTDIVVFGDIAVSDNNIGVYIEGINTRLFIGKTSELDGWQGDYGISAANLGVTIENHGLISGYYGGIQAVSGVIENHGTIRSVYSGISSSSEFGLQIANSGTIDAGWGISVAATGTAIINAKGAEIRGTAVGVELFNEGEARLVNHGTIRGGDAAIRSEDTLSLYNRGRIIGDIELGEGRDIIDTRKGRVDGVIRGGEGDDSYRISSTHMKIDDRGSSTADVVLSSATYRLVGGLDHLQIVGRKDINATGNEGNNIVIGNLGDNRVSGMDGADVLSGSAGNDRLSGGDGADSFYFSRNYDIDTITDFENGIDLIRSDLVQSLQDFDDLAVKRSGDDLVVDFGRGDRLILLGMTRSEFDVGDFDLTS